MKNKIPHQYNLISNYITILFALLTHHSFAQDPKVFNDVYRRIYLETAQNNTTAALKKADSLYKTSELPLFKAKSLMLSATINQMKGEVPKAIQLAEQANDILERSNDIDWQLRALGFLTSRYRELGLYEKSKLYSDKALLLIPQVKDSMQRLTLKGFFYQEQAFYYNNLGKYKKSIECANESQNCFNYINNSDVAFQSAQNYLLLGLNNNGLGDYLQAKTYLNIGKELIDSMPSNYLQCSINYSLASVYMHLGDLITADNYLDSANNFTAIKSFPVLQLELLKTEEAYYLKVNNIEKVSQVRKIKDSLQNIYDIKKTQLIDGLIVHADTQIKKEKSSKSILYLALIICWIISVSGGFIYFRTRKKYQKRFNEIMFSLKSERVKQQTMIQNQLPVINMFATNQAVAISNEAPTVSKSKELMTDTMVEKVLSSLKEFEESTMFLSKGISLTFLANEIKTNTKYLSYVLNHILEKDFSTYINELRINYLVQKLNNFPIWRNYKIAVLADNVGFQSVSNFSQIFKSIVGMPPSVFIKKLSEVD